MTNQARCIAAAIALFSASAAISQTPAAEPAPATAAAPLKTGAVLTSSDGKRIGRIERVVTSKEGAPVSASVILDSRFVYVPASTITATAGGFVTSLSKTEIRRLK